MPTNYVKQKIPIHQKMVGDAVRLGNKTPYIHTLVELDATQCTGIAYARIVEVQAVNLFPFRPTSLACCAKAIQQDPSIQRTHSICGTSPTADLRTVDRFLPHGVEYKNILRCS